MHIFACCKYLEKPATESKGGEEKNVSARAFWLATKNMSTISAMLLLFVERGQDTYRTGTRQREHLNVCKRTHEIDTGGGCFDKSNRSQQLSP